MKVSLNWLQNYVDISGLSPKEIAQKLTMAGLEVEGTAESTPIKNLTAALIEEISDHPDAKKLHICKVFDGNERYQVVCGAPNARAGMISVLAKVGAEVGGIRIKESLIRGVASSGMLCSEKELGLSDEHSGILELPPATKLGSDPNEALGIGDTVFEVAVTPNRGDCLSIYGIAREVSALFLRELFLFPFAVDETAEEAASVSSVATRDTETCPYYTARIIRGVKPAPSPLWMQNKIKSAGMRPVNNIVDVTNYVMLEYGQPLHAFDLKVIDRGIIVRRAFDGEEILTLDGKKRRLDPSVTVIADHSKTLAIAGVMGGEYSGINDDTEDIFLECACFNPVSIALTSRKLGMNTDSAYRYVRGIDFGKCRTLLDYAADLLSVTAGGRVLAGALTDGHTPPETRSFTFPLAKVNKLIGVKLKPDAVFSILSRLNITASLKENGEAEVMVPSYRNDIKHTADIAEETARIYGIERIPSTVPAFVPTESKRPPEFACQRELRNLMTALGFSEAINYSFLPDTYLAHFTDIDRLIYLINPISADMNALRPFLFASVIKSLEHNWNQGERSVRLFEVSSVFKKTEKARSEPLRLAFGLMGDFAPLSWSAGAKQDNFFYLKGVCENVLAKLGAEVRYQAGGLKFLHPGKSAEIILDDKAVGFLGALHPSIAERLDLKADVYVAELCITELFSAIKTEKLYKRFSRFPPVYKDISLVVEKNVAAEDLRALIFKTTPLIQNVTLFDIYTGEGLGSPKEKSLTYRIFFSSLEKTLTDNEINPLLFEIEKRAGAAFNARLR
jgi:phenylalanyl-tRNA synthetase beta chain